MVPATLSADLLAIFEDLDAATTAAQKAQEIAAAIDAYIRTATVTTTTQTVVGPLSAGLQTTVALGSPTGPPAGVHYLAGDGTGSLS